MTLRQARSNDGSPLVVTSLPVKAATGRALGMPRRSRSPAFCTAETGWNFATSTEFGTRVIRPGGTPWARYSCSMTVEIAMKAAVRDRDAVRLQSLGQGAGLCLPTAGDRVKGFRQDADTEAVRFTGDNRPLRMSAFELCRQRVPPQPSVSSSICASGRRNMSNSIRPFIPESYNMARRRRMRRK